MPAVEASTAFRELAPALAASVLDAFASVNHGTAAAVRTWVDSHSAPGALPTHEVSRRGCLQHFARWAP